MDVTNAPQLTSPLLEGRPMAIAAVSVVAGKPAGNPFETLFHAHHELVYRTAYSLLGNTADAEDVLQTVFLRLIRREVPPDFQNNVRGYFYRAAVNIALDVIRSRKRFEVTADAERFERPVNSCGSDSPQTAHQGLTKAMAELSPEAAHILVLRYVHGYSDAEIAKLLGRSRSAIAVALFRSRARLKKLLRELEGEQR